MKIYTVHGEKTVLKQLVCPPGSVVVLIMLQRVQGGGVGYKFSGLEVLN